MVAMGKTLAHLSDLHFGASPMHAESAREIVGALRAADVDHVVVTGDITNAGRAQEWELFHGTFAPLFAEGRVTVVPGNHDRLGDDVGGACMGGRRVDTVSLPGAHLVRVDSTGPHNRSSVLAGHGRVCERVLAEISAALDAAPADALVVILLHHHPVVLPAEGLLERLSATLNLPFTAELSLGVEMLRQAVGRCDLVLHGHRHVPSARILDPTGPRPLRVYNAGCSTLRRGMNVFTHAAGALRGEPRWLLAGPPLAEAYVDVPPYQPTEYRLAD
jgi:3',5'-cyclic AMP phosphodiesterase CpdA